MIFSLSIAAMLIAAPAQGKPSEAASIQAEAASTAKAADSAAAAADSANKAAIAAEHAAEAAAKAAEAAAAAAQAIQKSAPGSTTVVTSSNGGSTTTTNTPNAGTGAPAANGSKTTETITPGNTKVVEVQPAGTPPPPPVPPVTWTSVINLGLIALTGNTQSLAFNVGGNVQRKGPEWIWGIKGSALYGQARDSTTHVNSVNAEAATLQVRGDKRITPAFSGYLLGGIDTDHIKSVEERPYGEIGASLVWFDVKEGALQKSTFRTDLGFRYGREYRFQYFPYAQNQGEVDIVAPHLGVGYRYAVTKEIIFTNDLDLVANLQGDARMLLLNTAKLAARLTDTFNLAVSFVINYDSLPPPAKQGMDTALTIGVDIAL